MQIIPGDKMLKNLEAGSTLLMTLIVLILLTVIGISGMNIVTTDLQVTGNYRTYQKNLYKSDGAVMQLGQICKNQTGTMQGVSGEFTSSKDAYKAAQNSSRWRTDAISASSISDAQYMWTEYRITPGEELSKGGAKKHVLVDFLLYGRGNHSSGDVIVQRRYIKRIKK